MFTREEVLAAALDLVREQGIAAVTARKSGEKLGSSSKPIFSLFGNMEDVPAYIRFAKEEKELFRLLFMRDRSHESIEDSEENKPLIELIQQNLGISEEDARLFHLEMWIFVHGMATMLATSYL